MLVCMVYKAISRAEIALSSSMPSHVKKRGFVAQRNDGVTSQLGKVCKNVEIEPHLQPLDNKRLNLRSAIAVRREWR